MVAVSSFYCYCGSGKDFSACCEPLICGQALAKSPEQLMRSRYSAYCHHKKNPCCYSYILQTYAAAARQQQQLADIVDFADSVRFVRLELLSDPGLAAHQVHFVASYLIGDRLELLDEVSDFAQEAGRWVYCSGVLTEHATRRISRNDSCPCGSGLKFKKCQHQNELIKPQS